MSTSESTALQFRPSPFQQETRYFGDVSGEQSIGEIIDLMPIDDLLKDNLVVFVGGLYVGKSSWDYVYPKKNTHVIIIHVPEGGGDDKNPLAMIAAIAISFVAPYLAGVILGPAVSTTSFLFNAVSFGISVVGSLLIGALFPPANAGNTPDNSVAPTQASYTITSQSNSARQYQSLPRLYGTHKMFPDVACQGYVVASGDVEYLHIAYNFGYGPLNLSDIYIGATPAVNFKSVDYVIHQNFKKGDVLQYYPDDVSTQSYNILLYQNAVQLIETVEATDFAILDINFPKALRNINQETANSEPISVGFSLKYRKAGTADAWQTLGSNRHEFSRGGVSYSSTTGITFEITESYKAQKGYGYLPWEGQESLQKVPLYSYYAKGSAIRINAGTVYVGNSLTIAGRVYIAQNTASAGAIVNLDRALEQPALVAAEVVVTRCSYQEPGGNCEQKERVIEKQYTSYRGDIPNNPAFSIRASTNKPFTLGITVWFPSSDKWEIEFIRTSAYDSTSKSALYDTTLRALKSAAYRAPITIDVPQTVLELRIQATDQLSGVVDTLSSVGTSVLAVYNGVDWNDEETTNPAWIYTDVLTGSANGRPLTYDRLHLESIKGFADYCDLNGYTCSFIQTGATTNWELMRNILSSGRGSPSIIDGKYGIIWEEQRVAPVQLFTPRNSDKFESIRSFIDSPDVIHTKFVDPLSEWQEAERLVYADGKDESNSVNREDLSLFGITDSDLAWKHGRYFLAEGILRQEKFSLQTDIENIIATRGDLVQVQYDVPKVGGVPGRIRQISGNVLTLDELVSPGSDLVCAVRTDQSTILSLDYLWVSDFEMLLSEAIPANVKVGDLVVTGQRENVTANYLLSSVQPMTDLAAKITMVPEAPEIHDADTGTIPPWDPKVTTPTTELIPEYVDIQQVEEVITYINHLPVVNFQMSWDSPVGIQPSFYEVYTYDADALEWRRIATDVKETQFLYSPDPEGTGTLSSVVGKEFCYAIVASSYSGRHLPVEGANISCMTAQGDRLSPSAPAILDLDVVSETIVLSWNFVSDPDVAGYVIRYDPDVSATEWDHATVLVPIVAWTSNTVTVNARVGTYFVKTVDTSNHESGSFASAKTSIPGLVNLQVYDTARDKPMWPGNFDQMEPYGTDRIQISALTDTTYYPFGFYEFADIVDLGDIYVVRCISYLQAHGDGTPRWISFWGPMSDIDPIAGDVVARDWDAWMEVRFTDNISVLADWVVMADINPISHGGSTDWTEWVPFYAADFTGQLFQFRIAAKTFKEDVTVVIDDAWVDVNLSGRVDGENDIVCPSLGLTVFYDPAYRDRPALQITQDTAQQGDYYVITNQMNIGFDINFFDSTDTPVERTFDWMAKGFGRLAPELIAPVSRGAAQMNNLRRLIV